MMNSGQQDSCCGEKRKEGIEKSEKGERGD